MKYFIDAEFLEGTQNKTFLGINVGKTKPTIDLISIGIVSDNEHFNIEYGTKQDGQRIPIGQNTKSREYYAISKDFNLKEAWNRFDWKRKKVNDGIPGAYKDYWIRDNVLKPIWLELYKKECIRLNPTYKYNKQLDDIRVSSMFNYKTMKYLINKYGKSNKQIAEEIREFVYEKSLKDNKGIAIIHDNNWLNGKPQFYGYYSDYDWVVFCWLFGNMINLPNGFPQYCIDLKQTLDEVVTNKRNKSIKYYNKLNKDVNTGTWIEYLNSLKQDPRYPKQTNEHHALSDARWTKQLYEFLNKL